MTIIEVMDKTLPLAAIKARLSEIVDGIELRHDRIVLTRNGRPAAVILHPDDLESLEETVDLLSNPRTLDEIQAAKAEVDAGHFLTADQVRSQFLDR